MKYPTLQEIFGFGKKDKKEKDGWKPETMYDALIRLGYEHETSKYGWLEDNSVPSHRKDIMVNLEKFWNEYPPGTPVKVKAHYILGSVRTLNNEPYFHDGFVRGDGYIIRGDELPAVKGSSLEVYEQVQAYAVVIPSKNFIGPTNTKKTLLLSPPKSQKTHSPYR